MKYSVDAEWLKRHHWWCWFWQFIHQRECNDYDGVCYNCRKDRYPSSKEFLRRMKKHQGSYLSRLRGFGEMKRIDWVSVSIVCGVIIFWGVVVLAVVLSWRTHV